MGARNGDRLMFTELLDSTEIHVGMTHKITWSNARQVLCCYTIGNKSEDNSILFPVKAYHAIDKMD